MDEVQYLVGRQDDCGLPLYGTKEEREFVARRVVRDGGALFSDGCVVLVDEVVEQRHGHRPDDRLRSASVEPYVDCVGVFDVVVEVDVERGRLIGSASDFSFSTPGNGRHCWYSLITRGLIRLHIFYIIYVNLSIP